MGIEPDVILPVPDEVGTADSGGVSIAWKRFGAGARTVLFVPTWNLVDSRSLRHQVDALRGRFRVITFDARGSGESDRPATGYGFGEHVADAVAVMEASGTSAAAIVTASRGASTAVLLAARHPALVERLVMIAPALNVEEATEPDEDDGFLVERERYEGWERYSAPSWRTDFRGFVEWFMAEVFCEPGRRRRSMSWLRSPSTPIPRC
jgi:pimeloyl-ACP methyl ester carboxylesterase